MTGRATSYPKGMGIKFINLPDNAAEILDEFVKENLQEIKESSVF
jgi:hypothetical protein